MPSQIVFVAGENLRVTEDVAQVRTKAQAAELGHWIPLENQNPKGEVWINPAVVAYVTEAPNRQAGFR
jgi:hypothetical protein